MNFRYLLGYDTIDGISVSILDQNHPQSNISDDNRH